MMEGGAIGMRVTKFYCPECDTIFGPPGMLPALPSQDIDPNLPAAARDFKCTGCGNQLEVYEHSLGPSVYDDPDRFDPKGWGKNRIYPLLYWTNPDKPRRPI